MTVQERIENRIVKDPSGCWLWQGYTQKGYGRISVGNKNKRVHRVYWEILNGPILNDLFVCHHCDVPCCVNPTHLFLGTQKENIQDMVRKGRGSLSKTECKRGHAFDKNNTYNYDYKGRKQRQCKICNRLRMAHMRINRG